MPARLNLPVSPGTALCRGSGALALLPAAVLPAAVLARDCAARDCACPQIHSPLHCATCCFKEPNLMRLPLLLHVVAYLLLMLLSAAICQHLLYQQLRSEAALQSNNLAAFLRYSIGRYQTLPARLAESQLLQQQLDSNPDQLSAYLAELQQSAAVADLYLLDT